MPGVTYFTRPKADWQRRYEALRASFVDRLSAKAVANRFDYTPGYINLLRHLFRTGKLDLSEPHPEGKAARYRVSGEVRERIRAWREKLLSAGDIAQLLFEDEKARSACAPWSGFWPKRGSANCPGARASRSV